jgi:23S rRNA (adenine2030-N6)-methyltransferase
VNYRHAYHAGNFADCLKHAVLVWLLAALARKDKPFRVLDTHAGAGFYDLDGAEAARTGEAARGIGRLLQAPPPALRAYVSLVERVGLYPGSPAIVRAMLREADQLVACELHPEEHAGLRRRMAGDARVAVHLRDGYEAVGAFLPPPQRRGLTLLDPPFESADEFERLGQAVLLATRRFAGGVVAAWYPVKHRAPVRAFLASVEGVRDMVTVELLLREPVDASRLNGCGLLVVNPPFGFEAAVAPMASALLARVGEDEEGAWAGVRRIADE